MTPINSDQLFDTLKEMRTTVDKGFDVLNERFDSLDTRTRGVERITDRMWLIWTFVGVIFMAIVPLWLKRF